MPSLPNYRLFPTTFVATIALTSNACLLAAAGAGAGGAVYITERDIDSETPLSVDAAADAVRRAFDDLDITQGKYTTEMDTGRERRTLSGQTDDRDVTVKVASSGAGSRVSVTVRRDEVLWDKAFARTILDRILAPH